MNEGLGAAPTTKPHSPRTARPPKPRLLAQQEGRWPECERGRGCPGLRRWTRSSGWRSTGASRSPLPDSGAFAFATETALRGAAGIPRDGCSGTGFADRVGQRLTCKLSGRRQSGALAARPMINSTASRPGRHSAGGPLERRVRRSPNDEATQPADHTASEAAPASAQGRAVAGGGTWTRPCRATMANALFWLASQRCFPVSAAGWWRACVCH